ncbi:MAG: Crp/Fnr family transcriptional regulator [Planctomycetota bacterium]|nr:MAG: Crp/Fnr family transcriptional regulator [Planctomycetota bacterium]
MAHPAEPANRLLAMLPSREFEKIAPKLERVTMELRQVICQPGDPIRYAHFPTTSMLSSIVVLSGGIAVEAATIGNEGMAGVGLLISQRASPYRVIQQVEGETLRISADHFEEALAASRSLRDIIQRYTFTLLQQSGQNAACNLHHPMDRRLSRWLLQTSDRAGRSDFFITQEFLSEMLGVSRQTVNGAARTLQERRLINYRRGHVAIQDRPGLEATACECYAIFNDTYARYMQTTIEKPADPSR